MKSIILSVKPQEAVNILNGEQTIIIKKSAPKETPFKVYLYCTSVKNLNLNEYATIHKQSGGLIDYRHSKVVAEFVCNKVGIGNKELCEDTQNKEIYAEFLKDTCLTSTALLDYAKDNNFYGYYITDLKIYDEPKELGEFERECKYYGKNCVTDDGEDACIHYDHSVYGCRESGLLPITRPPQSWQYCEEREYHKTIFSDMKPDKDFIIAFFPCTYFTDTNEVQFKMYFGQKEPVKTEANVKRILKRIDDRAHHFSIWNKFCFICQKREIPTIIENPAVGNKSYLKLYSAWQPSWVESDRTLFGDYFKKPTYFFAINFEMKERFMMFDKEYKTKIIRNERGKTRSEITPLYADNFYKRFLERFIENVSAAGKDKTSCQ